ncbi:MAG: ABC transporter [Candidatus Rokuibacteriota bacterium]|nr:MAG: ABC transporter [Candidatus Rokubacteria bacterium]
MRRAAAVSRSQSLTPALLRVSEVTISYPTESGTFTAVEDVSFEVTKGEKFILLGPSGCGKSTLLKSVAGFIAPARGEVELDGRRVSRPGPDRVVVFQEFDQLLPWRTGMGNVTYPLRVARKMDDVAIDPAMLLMDEPFASLDALTRRKMQEELLTIWEATRKTILFVTHSIQEAVLLGDRILILSTGPGRVRRLIDNPAAGQRETVASLAVQREIQEILGE